MASRRPRLLRARLPARGRAKPALDGSGPRVPNGLSVPTVSCPPPAGHRAGCLAFNGCCGLESIVLCDHRFPHWAAL
eukprot:4575924-Alexandrium_andersonii.AAC.1